MRNAKQLQQALRKVENVSAWAKKHGIARRTLCRIIAGAQVRKGTAALVDLALNADAQ